MAFGMTNSTSITKMIKNFVAELQFSQEHDQMMVHLIETEALPKGMGLQHKTPFVGAIEASEVAMNEEYDNAQELIDDSFTITPTEKIVQMLWPRRLELYISEKFPRIAGKVMSNALEYKRDTDLITLFASTTGVIGDGTHPLTLGPVSAGMAVIEPGIAANGSTARTGARATGDPTKPPFYVVVHPYGGHDLRAQFAGVGGTAQLASGVAGANNYPQGAGATKFNEEVIRHGFKGMIAGAALHVNGNIAVSANKYKGCVFAREAFKHVTYQGVQHYEDRSSDGRFIKQTAWIDYGFGIQKSVAAQQLWLDGTLPTS